MLDVYSLSSSFRDLTNMKPVSVADAATRWAKAYYNYANGALAIDAKPLLVGKKDSLIDAFSGSMVGQTFMDDLQDNISSFWANVSFQGPSFVGQTQGVIGGPAFSVALATFIANNKAKPSGSLSGSGATSGSVSLSSSALPENTLDPLATILHAYTLTVTVQGTNPSTGVPVVTTIL